MSVLLHCRVEAKDGELLAEETVILQRGPVRSIAKQFTTIDGDQGKLIFEFDPPLEVPADS